MEMHARNVILFGAGASFGSDRPDIVPPTTDRLFDELVHCYPGSWGKLPEPWPSRFRDDFEAAFADLERTTAPRMSVQDLTRALDAEFPGLGKLPSVIYTLQKDLCRFFNRFEPSSANLYTRLGHDIVGSSWNGVVATLNYDRLLHSAFQHSHVRCFCEVGRRMPVNVLARPPVLPPVELCFPHGNSGLFVSEMDIGTGFVPVGFSSKVNAPVVLLDSKEEIEQQLTDTGHSCVMSFFEPSKSTTFGSSFVDRQRQRLNDAIHGAKTVAIVGVRVRERDTHIWQSLAQTSARLVYCGGNEGDQFRNWVARVRPDKSFEVFDGYFAERYGDILQVVGIDISLKLDR